jgi:hypothetical protein
LCGVYKKEKERFLLLIHELDIKAENCPLNVVHRAEKKEVDECIAKLRRAEETSGLSVPKLSMCKKGGTIRNIST